eukprot:2754301-Rhodomonas_salina.1
MTELKGLLVIGARPRPKLPAPPARKPSPQGTTAPGFNGPPPGIRPVPLQGMPRRGSTLIQRPGIRPVSPPPRGMPLQGSTRIQHPGIRP